MTSVLLGYQGLHTAATGGIENGERVIQAFAQTEGYSLGAIFVERDPTHPTSALDVLINAAQDEDVDAVVVSSVSDLGRTAAAQRVTRDWIENGAGVRLLVLQALAPRREQIETDGDEIRISFGVKDVYGCDSQIVFAMAGERVEVSHGVRIVAVASRADLRTWLWHHRMPFVVDDLRLRKDAAGKVKLFIDDQPGIILPTRVHAGLRDGL